MIECLRIGTRHSRYMYSCTVVLYICTVVF
eukprot:COSAG02_NODE_53196_length_303_cov_0.862745_1_plen_29_part_01